MTAIADTAVPDFALGEAAEEPGAIQVDLRPAPQTPAADPRAAQSPAAVRYEQFRIIEPEAIRRFYASAYTPGWRVSEVTRRSTVTHRRCATGSMAVDDVSIQGQMMFEIPRANTVVVIQPRADR